jgi:hypothetical protein
LANSVNDLRARTGLFNNDIRSFEHASKFLTQGW